MNREIQGATCEFDLTTKGLRLHPILFNSKKTKGNECHCHGHVGEAKAGQWAMDSERYYLWGAKFTWLVDCKGLLWILFYDGPNHIIRRWIVQIMGYFFTIHYREPKMMVECDGLSRLDQPDPLLIEYEDYIKTLKQKHPPASKDVHDYLPNNNIAVPKSQQIATSAVTVPIEHDFKSTASIPFPDAQYYPPI